MDMKYISMFRNIFTVLNLIVNLLTQDMYVLRGQRYVFALEKILFGNRIFFHENFLGFAKEFFFRRFSKKMFFLVSFLFSLKYVTETERTFMLQPP